MSDYEDALTGAEAAPAPEESVQDTPQIPAPVEPDAQSEDEKARDEKGRFVQKRINELTREKHEARRYAENLQRERDQLAQEVARYRQPAPPNPADDPEAFIEHLVDRRTNEVLSRQQEQWQQQQEQQRMAHVAAEFSQRAQSYAADNPAFEEAIHTVDQFIGNNPALIEVLATSEFGPQVVAHLADHLDELAQIAQLPPHLAAARVARLEARVSVPKPKPVTAAPAPTPTVGGASANPTKDPSRMSDAEWWASIRKSR